jgi:catalase
VFEYWANVDAELGKRIEEAVREGRAAEPAPHATEVDGVIG